MAMKSAALLDHYLEERNQLLKTISELLERDPRVKAAWLFGSMGRGDEDALSDIDLWVIVDDDQIANVIAHSHQFASQIGDPVLLLEVLRNAPEGGAYMMACYDAPVAPHIVDWYWQPQSLAYISGQVRLLFDKVGLIHKDQPIQFPGRPANEENPELPIQFISFFWMMLMIAAKYVCRFPWEEEMELLPLLVDPMVKAQHFIGQDSILSLQNLPHHQLPGEKLQLLHTLADQMCKIMAAISEQGEAVPSLITPGVYRYLKLIDLILEDDRQ